MSSKSHVDSRLAALGRLNAVLGEHKSLAEADTFEAGLESRDAAFARRLAYGVLRWYAALDFLANRMLDHPLKPRDRDVHRLILLGLYQLWKEDTAAHAAVHATAGCGKRIGKTWSVGLVNAILRRFQRERGELLEALAADPARYAHPAWLLTALREDWPEHWEDITLANNTQAPMWVRCNRTRTTLKDMSAQLAEAGFRTAPSDHAPDALLVEPPAPVEAIPGFAEGMLSIQDAAAQLAAPLLDPQSGERVLDACAAPGGKTCHLMELQPGLHLTALDRTPERSNLITENLERTGARAEVLVGDALEPQHWWDGRPYARILLDAPCSATGVIRRHPEIKLLRQPEQVEEAVRQQAGLLEALWPLLEAGGMLVYATCSVLKCENSRQVEAFLERHPDARCSGPDALPGQLQKPGWQILPGQEGMDGFYYAVLHKSV